MTYSLTAVTAAGAPALTEDIFAQASVDPLDQLRDVLAGTVVRTTKPSDPRVLARAAVTAKRRIQRCDYTQLASHLPGLLADLTPGHRSESDQQRVDRVAVDAYHVAASLFLKNGDPPSAWVAAERSMAAARRVGDPAAIATASRILTHAVTAVGHHRQSLGVAIRGADEISGAVTRSQPDRVAVFGALLLRGAWAASAADDRDTASTLLDEAERAAALMKESNRCWTAFGPNNVLLHRVTIALTLGDAGKALVEARKVDVKTLAVAERRAVFWTDVAHALHACGRSQKATAALLAAEREAPQEVRSRPVVRKLIGELLMRDQGGQVALLRSLASRAGVAV
ncbi:hypothetical protein AB0K09_27255 [Streptomyces sp. NPDC049577]|uniref:hypothetical protein n=1 Tax=Streptomyces sp. NPDC049577 TaxID=3155153 RepID=UPI00343EE10E